MIESLFLDLDDTILDFQKAERLALAKTLREFSLTPDDGVLTRYHLINKAYWERLERKELTREQVLVGRFAQLLEEFSIDKTPALCAKTYERNLSIGHYFLPGAFEAVQQLHKRYRLFLASNGTASVQKARLTSAELYPWFEQVFVSQELGHNKPSREFFQGCFDRIPGFRPENCMMVGDSLTSDILGGKNAGLLTCWVNPLGKPHGDIVPDYEIKALSELEALLESIE